MLHLMKLELKKFKLGWYVKRAIIANIVILAVMIFMSIIAQVEGDAEIRNPETILLMASTIVRATFIIFGSVLIARLIIGEYKNKTILLMFSYPINRKKMMASKLAITAIVTFITVIVSNILVVGIFFGIDSYFSILPNSFTVDQLVQEGIKLVPLAIATAGMSLIPLYFGMRKRSVPTTIVSSLIVVSIAMNSNPEFSTATFLPLQLALAAIGVAIAYYGIKNIEKEDITV
ncbi:ABC transporter permease [Bacillus paranthracis]|uniref:ABC transporter permease n=1 Tax=Bacillus cereus group TaxID=86661 RepID=UPI0005E8504F|nr:ABC transporter permease [Bacillus paranthracis]CKF06183.1 ABC-type transport system involved in multi-copper enzyme maturation%2C permease component [Streptococcus pneumoniae]MDK7474819.1 ABC transporter permease [Bacillus paranthracis]CKF43523.1 ABC-type transport system involved in multi-copper enzyme maturation%2C permease component [Streptococcus pneumoniae]CKG13814.1 ABC-type transport system involved in multi-copper enzyme maturation%2C permease component [Bacillus paranthracis]CKG55